MATRTVAFKLEFEGSGKVNQQLSQVELDLAAIGKQLQQVRKDINTFNTGTDEQRAALEASGKSIQGLTQEYTKLRTQQVTLQEERKGLNRELRDQVKAFQQVESAVPKDSLIGLRTEYRKLRKEIDLLGKDARESGEGLEKVTRAGKLKQEIIDIGRELKDGRENVGRYLEALQEFFKAGGANGSAGNALSGVLGDIINPGGPGGGGLGGVIGKATAALGPYGVAIAGVATATQLLGTYIVDITKEFELLNNTVGTTTGLVGLELTEATVGVRTLSQVFNKDFNEILIAANASSKQFGVSFTDSLEAIRVGLQGGADLQGQFLDNLREYSSEADRAGLSIDGFVEALIRFERAGIFQDRGADIINELETRISEFNEATKTALNNAFGDEFTNDLFTRVNDGSTTAIEAAREVAIELEKGNLTTQQYQEVVANTFGSLGEDAGAAIKVLTELTGTTDGLVNTTDAYTQRQNAAFDATQQLNIEQQKLAAQFAGTTFDLTTLTTRLKAFGTSLLNDALLNIRVVTKEFQEGNFLEAFASSLDVLFLGYDGLAEKRQAIVEQDAIALREVEEGEAKLAEERRKNAVEGVAGINELRAEQQRLKEDIDAARVAGEDYSALQQQLTSVTKNLSEATGILNTNVARTKNGYKDVVADGSIDQLSERVQRLQEQIGRSTPNQALKLIEDLQQAELDLSNAERELEEFKQQVRETNFETLPISEQVEILERNIELRRQVELQAAEQRIADEQTLAAQIALINAESDKQISEARIKQFDETEAEYIELSRQIAAANESIQTLEIDVELKDSEATLREIERLTTQALQGVFEDEQELQDRLQLLRLQTETATIERQLQLANLSTEQRFDLEQQLISRTAALREAQARVDIDFATRLNAINADEADRTLVPTFDPDNIDESLNAIRAFEEQRTLIESEAELKRLELQKELLEAQGEETLSIEQQIAEQSLSIEQQKNAGLIAEAEKRAKAQADFANKVAENEKKAFEQLGESLGNFLISSAEDSEQAFKNLGQGILSTVIDLIAQQATLLVSQAFAQPDSVATFGATGGARVAIITGLIQGASAALKGLLTANLSAEGNLLQGGGSLTGGGVFAGKPHSQGGVKFLLNGLFGGLQEAEVDEAIIKATSTQKWLGLLSAINVDGGGKNFAADTAKYLRILKSIKPTRYNTGGQIGGSSIPMLINPNSVQGSAPTARISTEDMQALATEIAVTFTEAGSEFAETIVQQVIIGLDTSNRLKEREREAQQNAEV